jgi:hypothetical protein
VTEKDYWSTRSRSFETSGTTRHNDRASHLRRQSREGGNHGEHEDVSAVDTRRVRNSRQPTHLNLSERADNLALYYGQLKQLRVEPTTAVSLARKLALAV